MIGIKLLDQIHDLWQQLRRLEDQAQFTNPVGSVRDQIYNLKTQINAKFAILEQYHQIDGLMNYSKETIGDEDS